MNLNSARLVKYLKLSASVAAFPVISVVGFTLLTGFWLAFFWKTGTRPPVIQDLRFLLDGDKSSLSSIPVSFSLTSVMNLVEIEIALRIPEKPDSTLPNFPYALILDAPGIEEDLIFNFFPKYRSPLIQKVRSLIKLPLYILFGYLEEEEVLMRSEMKINSNELRTRLTIRPPLPIYKSHIKLYSVQRGIAKFIHKWKVLSVVLLVISNLLVSMLVSALISLSLFYYSLKEKLRPDLPQDEEDSIEDLNIDNLFEMNKF